MAEEYVYTARDDSGILQQGSIQAESLRAAVEKLAVSRLYAITVIQSSGRDAVSVLSRGKRVKRRELVFFTRQLSDLLGAGATLSSSLETLTEQTVNPHFAGIVREIHATVNAGESFSSALKKHSAVFPELYVGMVQTGETCGMMREILGSIGDYLEKEEETRTRIISSIAYPLIAAGVGIVTMIFLFAFVIPRLVNIFNEIHQTLPLPTRIVIGISSFMVHYWWIAAAVVVAPVCIIRRTGSEGVIRQKIDTALLKLPLWGDVLKKREIARISRTLGMCLQNGVPLLTALEVVQSVINARTFKDELTRIQAAVRDGGSMAASMRSGKCFPGSIASMVAIGEESNTLGTVFAKVETNYSRDLDTAIKIATTLIEPLTIVTLGVIVGLVVIAVLLPIFKMNFNVY